MVKETAPHPQTLGFGCYPQPHQVAISPGTLTFLCCDERREEGRRRWRDWRAWVFPNEKTASCCYDYYYYYHNYLTSMVVPRQKPTTL